jgi:hypothetical protein
MRVDMRIIESEELMPNKTIYISNADLPLWEEAQRELGESISSGFVEYLRERLERRKEEKLDMVQAIDALLSEVNSAYGLGLERHPAWSPFILDANSVNIGYKLHQKRAEPDRVMSLVVSPLDFDNSGRLIPKTKSRITAEVRKCWDGKNTQRHIFVDASS